MRLWVLMLGLICLVTGCAVGGASRSSGQGLDGRGAWEADAYEPASATMLVFDPPVAAHQPVVELPRGPRASSAFVGFEELQAHFFHVRIDDRQTNDWRERYERRAIIHQSGVRYR